MSAEDIIGLIVWGIIYLAIYKKFGTRIKGKFNSMPLGFQRLSLVGMVIPVFLTSYFEDRSWPENIWDGPTALSLFGGVFIGIPVYWVVIFIAFWIYDGFKK